MFSDVIGFVINTLMIFMPYCYCNDVLRYHAWITGLYCEDWGLFAPTGSCQAGYYCIAGTHI